MENDSIGSRLMSRYYWFAPAIIAGFLLLLVPTPWAPILLFLNHGIFVWGARLVLEPPQSGLLLPQLLGQVLFQVFFGVVAGLFVGVPLALAAPGWDWVSLLVLATSVTVFLLIALKSWPAQGSIVADFGKPAENPFSALARGCRVALALTRERLEFTLAGIPILLGVLLLGSVPAALYFFAPGLKPAAFYGAAAAYLMLLAPWISSFVVSEVLRILSVEPADFDAQQTPDHSTPAATQPTAIMSPPDFLTADPLFNAPSQSDPLLSASVSCHFPGMQNAVDRGSDVNTTGEKDVTPLILVVKSQHPDRVRAIQWLVDNGADPSLADATRNGPIHYAAILGDHLSTEALIKTGANPQAENADQMGALAAACSTGQWNVAQTLIKAKAPVAPERGISPLHAASMQNDDDPTGVELLLKAGAKVNHPGKLGRTALMGAALKGNAQISDVLLKSGADINARDDFGNTALMEAARSGANQVLERFVFWNPDTEPRDKPGRTALLVAVSSRRSNPETIRLLMAMGANPKVRNREDREAADLAAAAGRWRIAKALGYKETATTVMSPNRLRAANGASGEDTQVIDLKRFQAEADLEWARRQLGSRSRTQLEAATGVMAAASGAAIATSRAQAAEPDRVEEAQSPSSAPDAAPEPVEHEEESSEIEIQGTEPSAEEGPEFELVSEPLEFPVGNDGSADEPGSDQEIKNLETGMEDASVELSEPASDENDEPSLELGVVDIDVNAESVEDNDAEITDDENESTAETLSDIVDLGEPDDEALVNQRSGVFEDPQEEEKLRAGYIALLESAKLDDVEQMNVVLLSQPEAPEWWLSSAFLNSVAHGAAIAPRWLLENGLSPNASSESGQPLLNCLVQQSPASTEVIELLLENGARAEASGQQFVWLGGYACHQHGIDSSQLDDDHEFALTSLIPKLIERGADLDGSDKLGRTALHWAVAHRGVKFVDGLLDHGADANARDDGGNSALIAAMDTDRPQKMGILRSLVKHGADPKLANDEGSTPMALAMESGDGTLLKILMIGSGKSKAPPPEKRDIGSLIDAAANGNLGRIKRLVASGADVDGRDKQGCTALLRAAGAGHPNVVTALLSEGANADLAASNGTTPLGAAVLGDHREIVKLLVDRGVPVDQPQQFGLTPLMLAAARWNPKLTQLLVKLGANVNQRDEMEGTALMAAVQNALVSERSEEGKSTVALLIEAGADVNAANDERQTALMLLLGVRARDEDAAETEALAELTIMLLEAGVDLDSQDLTGWSALHAAAAHGFFQPTRELLARGASRRLRDINGLSACDLAMDHSHDKLVDLFLSS